MTNVKCKNCDKYGVRFFKGQKVVFFIRNYLSPVIHNNIIEAEFKEFQPRLNLSRGSKMVGFKFFKILAGAQLKPVFGDLRRGLNSLNSDTALR